MFLHQTIADAGRAARHRRGGRTRSSQRAGRPVPVPLTPIQHWFFDDAARAAGALRPVGAGRAGRRRRRARRCARRWTRWWRTTTRCGCGSTQVDGGWRSTTRRSSRRRSCAGAICPTWTTTSSGPRWSRSPTRCTRASTSTAGPLLRAVLFDLGADRRPRLFLAVHHLVVDGVSWRILLEDLETAYRQAAAGEPVRARAPRPPRSGSGRARLAEHVARRRVRRRAGLLGAVGRRPRSDAAGRRRRRQHGRLDPVGHGPAGPRRDPARCCSDVPGGLPHPGQRRAAGRAGPGAVPVDRARPGAGRPGGPRPRGAPRRRRPVPHGRLVHHRCSRSRWTCPAGGDWGERAQVGQGAAARGARAAASATARCATWPTAAPRCADAPAPQISFNYLGQFDWLGRRRRALSARCPAGWTADASPPSSPRRTCSTWSAAVEQRRPGARPGTTPSSCTTRRTVRRLAERDGRRRCGRSSSTARSRVRAAAPRRTSRWPGSTRPTVDRLVGDGRGGRGRLPADPDAGRDAVPQPGRGRAGRLLRPGRRSCWTGWPTRARSARPGSGWWTGRRCCAAAVVWEGVDRAAAGGAPRGHACRSPTTTGATCPTRTRQPQLARLLAEDRAAGLDLAAAPLMRLVAGPAVGRPRSWWSGPSTTSCSTAGASFAGPRRGVRRSTPRSSPAGRPELPARRPFRDYLQLAAPSRTTARPRSTGGGCCPASTRRPRCPTTGRRRRRTAPSRAQSVRVELSAEPSPRRLREVAQRNGLTAQHGRAGRLGAAAVALQRRARRRASAPPCPAARPTCPASSRWSACSSTPCRPGSTSTTTRRRAAWLRELQDGAGRVPAASTSSRWPSCRPGATCPAGVSLFDSIVVFENYPIDDAAAAAHGLRVRELQRASRPPTIPLSRGASPRRRGCRFELGYDPALFDARHGRADGRATCGCCSTAIAADPDRPVGELPLLTERRAAAGAAWSGTTPRRDVPARRSRSCSRRRSGATPGRRPRWSAGDTALTLRRAERAGEPAGAPAGRAWASARSGWWRWRCRGRPRWSWRMLAVLKAGGGVPAGGPGAAGGADRRSCCATPRRCWW